MEKISKIFLSITFIWYIVFSLLAVSFEFSNTTLQIIFSFPIAFLGVIAADKPKSLELVSYMDRKKEHEKNEYDAQIAIFNKWIKSIESSYNGHPPIADIFHHLNCSVLGAIKVSNPPEKYDAISIDFDINHPDILIVQNKDTHEIGIAESNNMNFKIYNDIEKRLNFYKLVAKKQGYKMKIGKKIVL